jgi:hypothetical protein
MSTDGQKFLTVRRVENLCGSNTWPIIRYALAALEEFLIWPALKLFKVVSPLESRAGCAWHIGNFQMQYVSLLVVNRS